MLNYADRHILSFADQWSNLVLPQLERYRYKDLTWVFKTAKKSRMIQSAIARHERIYVLGFKGCRGMIKKWLYDERGRMVRNQGAGVVDINPSVITMAAVDINLPFITSDEVLLVPHQKDKPYFLERDVMKRAMIKAGFDPDQDIIFIFFVKPNDIRYTVQRFIDDFKFLLTREYCRAKGIIAITDPKWTKYHASEEVTKYTNSMFFAGVRLIYTRREANKRRRVNSGIMS